ncbi:peritrophin-55 [Drosophila willistoni]|nr:peritrophin-55 [Drosophila willistoni]
MKAVLFVVATLMAVSIHAQSCNVPEYENAIDTPIGCIEGYPNLKLPNYENPGSYYTCTDKKANTTGLVVCSEGTYFSYPLQRCASCKEYIPTVRCHGLTINVTCVPINGTSVSTTTVSTTVKDDSTESGSSSSTTTTTTTTTTTEAPGESSTTTTTKATTTTTSAPTPPTADETTTTTASDDSVVTPSGTTIAVPGPPSPADSDVPSPETPVPTAPVIVDEPPTPSS